MGAGTWESHHAITTLVYRYAECVDGADFDGLAALFEHGRLRSTSGASDEGMRGAQIARFYEATNKVHPDGTLRTRHLTTNLIVDIDEAGDVASARSAYLVLQATPKLPFQPIVAGRYEDRFTRSDGRWHFADRLIHVDQLGDLREHLSFDLSKGDIAFDDVVPRS